MICPNFLLKIIMFMGNPPIGYVRTFYGKFPKSVKAGKYHTIFHTKAVNITLEGFENHAKI